MKARVVFGALLAAVTAAGTAALLVSYAADGSAVTGIARDYLRRSIPDTGSINVVSAILLDYRAFDTLGEATVIFASVASVGALFTGFTLQRRERGLSILVRRAISYLASLLWLFPVYVVLHGHISPGGGFQGGVALAVFVILINVVFGTQRGCSVLPPVRLHITESAAAMAFLMVGAVGVFQGAHFLSNIAAGYPYGRPGSLLSAGMIPILNLVIGCKVTAGLGSIFLSLLSTEPRQ